MCWNCMSSLYTSTGRYKEKYGLMIHSWFIRKILLKDILIKKNEWAYGEKANLEYGVSVDIFTSSCFVIGYLWMAQKSAMILHLSGFWTESALHLQVGSTSENWKGLAE